jgi:hypothetical protein
MRRLWLTPCWLATAVGCSLAGTETGNPTSTRDVSFALVLRSTNSDLVEVGDGETDHGTLRIDAASLATDSVDLMGCVGQDHTELASRAWDLLRPEAQALATSLPAFCGVRLDLTVADAGLAASVPGLEGASLWLTATRADGVRVEVRSSTALTLTYQDSTHPVDAQRMVVAWDAAAWFSAVNVATLAPDPDGVVRLSPSSNPLSLQTIEQSADEGTVLREERVDDGVSDG